MRSLTIKLTLAFLLSGLIVATLVAVLIGQRTRSEFDRFLSEHDQAALLEALASYYSAHSGWQGVGEYLADTPPLDFYSRGIALLDGKQMVVLGRGRYPVGQPLPAGNTNSSTPITVDGKAVGFVVMLGPNEAGAGARPPPPPPAQLFLQQVAWASGLSAVIASLIALVVGGLLARTLARPVRELTAATRAMAGGQLGQQVAVRSSDEIGELAIAFNHMSSDLARASQLRKQMTADLAHDLRTPLSILRGYTEGLTDGRLQGSQSLYTIMHGEVEHLQRMVEDLRVLSLADAGELPLNRRAVDPAALIERTGLAYIMQAEQQHIGLRVEADEQLPSIAVDTDRMTQVLNNLVSNALRYTNHGEIVLTAAAENRRVYLSVCDTGSGIAAEDLPYIFDRFYRADKARQRNDSNASGLGLAIAKAIVEAHGGAIAVDSAPGRGTTFTMSFPAVGA